MTKTKKTFSQLHRIILKDDELLARYFFALKVGLTKQQALSKFDMRGATFHRWNSYLRSYYGAKIVRQKDTGVYRVEA